jgi:superfamily II DNA/RNA helicase
MVVAAVVGCISVTLLQIAIVPSVQAWVAVVPTSRSSSRNSHNSNHFVVFSNRVVAASDFGSSQNGTAVTTLQQQQQQQRASNDKSSSSSSTNNNAETTTAWSLERTAAHLQKLQRQQEKLQKRNFFARGGTAGMSVGISAGSSASSSSSSSSSSSTAIPDPLSEERERLYQLYLRQAATELKRLLSAREMPTKGRKPDLARRLARDDLETQYGWTDPGKHESISSLDSDTEDNFLSTTTTTNAALLPTPVTSFGALTRLSHAASMALTRAQFIQPFAIQRAALAWIVQRQSSCILHAATGTGTNTYQCVCVGRRAFLISFLFCNLCTCLFSMAGKTLAYLLPITERLWQSAESSDHCAFIVTPTRELAAQVAGIATVLAPPGSVRLVSRPMDLTARLAVERSQLLGSAAVVNEMDATTNVAPRLFIGSATAIYHSLYGDGKMPASPTSKPQAMAILQSIDYLVLDEVDRLLNVVGGGEHKSTHRPSKKADAQPVVPVRTDEMPAAILTAAVMRLTLGQAQVVAASATVGRPLRRELARCMGLTPQECPPTIREQHDDDTDTSTADTLDSNRKDQTTASKLESSSIPMTRAVTIPATVQHFYVSVAEGSSPGKILTAAYAAIQSLYPTKSRFLLVLTRNFGINIVNTVGALRHFSCRPEPVSLLEALEADGTRAMMEVHRKVTGATGVGSSFIVSTEASSAEMDSHMDATPGEKAAAAMTEYLYVTNEDSVRGLHLDSLDVVVVAGRPVGPDEYTHIAGRTGRAGKRGCVVNILSDQDAGKLGAWEKMLNIEFQRCESAKVVGDVVMSAGEESTRT